MVVLCPSSFTVYDNIFTKGLINIIQTYFPLLLLLSVFLFQGDIKLKKKKKKNHFKMLSAQGPDLD